jgi:hypothetical protein
VKVFDGQTNDSAVIGTYCGQQRNLVLYSSDSSLFVTFDTLPRTANTQNRGFKGIFEFSESFVKLGTYCLNIHFNTQFSLETLKQKVMTAPSLGTIVPPIVIACYYYSPFVHPNEPNVSGRDQNLEEDKSYTIYFPK